MNIYTRILICLAAIAVLAAPSCAAPTPFVIGGWIFYENGTNCDDPAVNITNTDTGGEWQAVTAANYYQIIYTNGTDLNESEQLQFSAKSPDGCQSNITEHDIVQGEVSAGGIFDFNITLTSSSSGEIDLIVDSVTPNCGYLFGNESNNISAVIKNIGNASASASHASFVSGTYTKVVSVPALGAGNDTTVSITYPTIRAAGAAVTITVSADCDGEVAESNETNNATVLDVTVLNNGYKGKTYSGGSNMTTWKSYDLHGNLVYSVGDSYYLSSSSYSNWTTYNASWTGSDLPVAGTVVEARLYTTYTWDKDGVMPGDVTMSFNGADQAPDDAHYWDEKGFDTSYPYGMLVYNVTDDFDTGGNVANLTNSHTGGDNVSMRGMMLVVVYENASEPQRLIYVNEEFDLLYGGSSKCTTPEEATAWAPITGSIDTSIVANATLITVAPGAGPNEGELIFNGQVWTDVWNFTDATQIGIDERDVKLYLESTDNLVGVRSSEDYMEASNAFLVVELVPKLQRINVTPASWTTNVTEYVTFTATGHAQNGGNISNLVFAWNNSNPYVGSLNASTGTAVTFTAEHVGITYLTASNRSVNGSVTSDPVQVTVNAPTVTENVTNGTGTATSGSSTAIVTLSNRSVNGTITIKGLGDPINSTTANGSTDGLTGVELIKGAGVNITASADVTGALNGTNTSWIHIKIEYNDSRLGDIDESTLFIYKYNGSGWVKLVNGSNNCTANGRNTTANYIWANVTHLCDFGAGGSTLAENGGNTGGSTGGGGGGGTYPPGWFGTPTPTVTATKAPAATPTATAAPPGERVTPAPTKAKPDAAKTATPAAKETAAGTPAKGAPGFTAVFMIAGVLAVAYAMMRRSG